MSSDQKVAIITGVSQGIGAALLKAYRDRDYRVVASSRWIMPSADDGMIAIAGDISDAKTAVLFGAMPQPGIRPARAVGRASASRAKRRFARRCA